MKKLLIFPCNGNGLEALSCIDRAAYEFVGFVDDTKDKQGQHKFGFYVYGREAFELFSDAEVLAVPGSSENFKKRGEIISGLNIQKNRFAKIIHPKATVSEYARIGNNVLIMAGTSITYNSVIDDHVCILPNTVIHHDSIIGEYTLIGSNVTIAGCTSIGKNCYIGSGSSIINNIIIGEGSLVGIGTNVISSISPNSKVVGNPARSIA